MTGSNNAYDFTWRFILSCIVVYVALAPIVFVIARLNLLPDGFLKYGAIVCALIAFPVAIFLGRYGPIVGSILPLLVLAVILAGYDRSEPVMPSWTATQQFTDKRVVIVGGTRGVGLQLVDQFSSRGAHVTYTYRSENHKNLFPSKPNVSSKHLDLKDWNSIESFAHESPIDILILNAAVLYADFAVEGVDGVLAVNYLSQAALALPLINKLKLSTDPVIIMVGSETHRLARFTDEQLVDWNEPYHKQSKIHQTLLTAYPRSKLLVTLFAQHLAVLHPKVRVYSTTPGPTYTELVAGTIGEYLGVIYPQFSHPLLRRWVDFCAEIILRPPTAPVAQFVYAAASKEKPLLKSGQFFFYQKGQPLLSPQRAKFVYEETLKFLNSRNE